MRVLITGHRGYIGTRLCEMIKANKPLWIIRGYDIIEGDNICDCDRLRVVLDDFAPKVIIHLAALSAVGTCHTEPERALFVNKTGTQRLVEAAKESGCKIVYAGTCAVYGNHPD